MPSTLQRSGRRAAVLALVAITAAASWLLAVNTAQAQPEDVALLSQDRPASASSVENPDYTPASAAFDGDPGTRWSSEFADPQWIQVDLGAVFDLKRVDLVWEGAYASSYAIQVSTDGTDWSTAYRTQSGKGGSETIALDAPGRYVRMHGLERATGYGYSLWSFDVYGCTAGDGGGSGGAAAVEVTGTQGDWRLTVDGEPFTVKGLTWGPSTAEAERWMPELKSMGVNTLRTWGTDASSLPLLDAAAAHDIKVMLGFWLLPGGGPGSGGCIDYVTDDSYKSQTLADIVGWVETYRDHPGVLMWNVGNESVLGLQNCYGEGEVDAQRHAYTSFVNDVAVAIHAVDDQHPVTSTDAWTGAWPYYKANAPDLDLLSVNAYQVVCGVEEAWNEGGYDKPYLITETGPAGEWEVPDDANGVPDEPGDIAKAEAYTQAWECITGHEGVALGATMFHFGTEGDFGGVWFNLIPGGNRRLAYYAVAEAYGGSPQANTPPVIASMDLGLDGPVTGGEEFTVRLDTVDPDGDAVEYIPMVNSAYINGSWDMLLADYTVNGDGTITVRAPEILGVWKLYVWAEDGHGNVGVESASFEVTVPDVEGRNVAAGKPTTASTFQEWGGHTPDQATDGDLATRWASEWADPQWIQVDLGERTEFHTVQLVWETSYAAAYQVQVSDDGRTWTTVHETSGGDGGADTITDGGAGRYVRVLGTERGTEWGYSLYEFGVYA
ncbi:discoidin domain-containing protein [Glycomyces sp. TRM65418]|uniref:discoidin domain-containing protein n=1 Tax=Glycomyces sp. TRM65418 TaxID=2867006 RepID=UPI001CE6D85E|nr:discoidin domain-containing protein [Glycomyces sp. TRM65418]MCC3763537.1 discoidin domain-containing protein [Glycomyces sp. TRM65418]QZD57520.1 discoidin domain-containing protein [Glycomyces sp. TRM65418]